MAPHWLTETAIVFLAVSGLSSIVITGAILFGQQQKMMIMNFVWPLTALWSGPLGLYFFWTLGRRRRGDEKQRKGEKRFWQTVLIGDCHCAAGCSIGDFIGEWIVFLAGLTIAGSVLWDDYALDFTFAYLAGIVFQYYSIAPMKGLSGWAGIKAALKADTISLVAFEIGMFAWMALSSRVLFHPKLEPTEPAYWLMMQVAMLVGFLTAYPANWWLIRKGIKEAM
jgi:Domain of unknown function (DUF4396)